MLKKLPAAVLALIMILASVMLPSLAAAEEAPVQAAQSALRMPEEGAQGVQAAEETPLPAQRSMRTARRPKGC